MKHFLMFVAVLAMLAISAPWAGAATTYQAFLSGLTQNPVNASPATGFGTVVLNDAQTMITVDESWSGLLAPATAFHIHGPGLPGVNAPILFGFTGVPAATSGSIPQQTFNPTPAQVADLQAGKYYMNVHTSQFPGGEIRGQLYLVPEPSAILWMVCGLLGITGFARRKAH